MFLGDVIYNYRSSHKLTMREFSALSGLSVPYISQLEKNRNPKTNDQIVPSLDTFVKVAKAMHISLDELLMQVDENQPVGIADVAGRESSGPSADYALPSNLSTPAAYPLPILGTICAGNGVIADESFDGMFFVDNSIRANYCLHVQGDSMVDAEIYDGDIVFILKDFNYEDGCIYAVVVGSEQEAVLKKLYREGDKVILAPCNSSYRPVFADPEDVLIVGKCIGVYRGL